MRPTFFGIEVARTGITVSQKGLDVTGHNVSNADTAGYTRQRLVNTAYDPYNANSLLRPLDAAMVGGGARIMILDQIRSSFLDRQFRTEQTALSDWTTRSEGLTYIRGLYENADGSSITGAITGLFDGFNAMVKESNDGQQRSYIRSQAQVLTDSMNHIYNRLEEQQGDQDLSVKTVVERINTLSEHLVELNKSIYRSEALSNQPANDLRDKRNLILDEMATYVDIEYEETMDNKFILKIDGHEIVNHITHDPMTMQHSIDSNGNPHNFVPGFGDPALPSFVPLNFGAGGITGGELKAHIDMRDSNDPEHPGIPYFMEQMNTLAQHLVKYVNEQHMKGWTSTTSGNASQTGQLFFETYSTNPLDINDVSNVTAGNIKLLQAIIDDPYNIAASSVMIDTSNPANMQKGNNENSLALYELLDRQDLGTIGSYYDFASSIVTDIAVTLNRCNSSVKNQQSVVDTADNQRASISGVSLDEEMTNLITYQHAFSGASRVLTTMDDALDNIINRMGRVGL